MACLRKFILSALLCCHVPFLQLQKRILSTPVYWLPVLDCDQKCLTETKEERFWLKSSASSPVKAEFQEVQPGPETGSAPRGPCKHSYRLGACVRNTHPWDIVQISAITSGVHKEKPRSWYTGTS